MYVFFEDPFFLAERRIFAERCIFVEFLIERMAVADR
jgi:hypothetical protein